MIAALLLIAVQDRVPIDPPTEAAPERRWSILADPYARTALAGGPPCPDSNPGEVVVCARNTIEERLPLPEERGPPDGPRKVVKYLDGAQGPSGPPCAADLTGCTTGIDLIGGVVKVFKAAKKITNPDAE
ncbi:MAG TPA: hypothetical protein VFQ57_02345 [Sphingomonas sp.]|jgi:hypothetical protein|nr:hypothetical protein [Sphingomonas sp.]